MARSFSEIPTVSLSWLQNPIIKPDELWKLREAIFFAGFLYLTDSGLENSQDPTGLLCFDAETKAKCDMINSPSFLGYTRLGAETTAAVTDQREQFDFGTPGVKEWSPSDPFWQRLEGPNQYPDLPGSRELVEEYFTSTSAVAKLFVGYVAECLGLPPAISDEFKGNMDRLKFVKYPPSAPGSQGVGPHKDSSGLFTFLLQDEVGGLQALNKEGQWIDVPDLNGCLVVNIQQGFEAITGGACTATTHRGLASTNKTRYSVPFFLGVRLDLTLAGVQVAAKHTIERIPSIDNSKKLAVDVPSEFLSSLYSCFGEAHLRNRNISHPDVGQLWYLELYAKYSSQVLE